MGTMIAKTVAALQDVSLSQPVYLVTPQQSCHKRAAYAHDCICIQGSQQLMAHINKDAEAG